ncbi:LOW QUALITY PROTEIN: Hypothetical protein PHPALM_8497 [Phytophthora palmivora]|uniref:Uncharacterized protein n=1 Tax=Phytophthora palmivora TaxID=4796 RepID=A0A2P4Y9Q6_9STRA|nr:LOW QUALITY PROTEIN: Hypothetical protein PHPALM_8497 [Phytophthora palmivora]
MSNNRSMNVPVAVRDAIRNYQPLPGFTLVPPKAGERSIILQWGVRVTVELDWKICTGWICLGSESCRQHHKIIKLYEKTSKATKHLKDVHSITSDKSTVFGALLSREMTLPALGEYEESRLLNELVTNERYRTTTNAQTVTDAIGELYASVKGEITNFIFENIVPNITFFYCFRGSSKTQGERYLGLRIYCIDNKCRFRSFLLGTRHFRPSYGERDGGIRIPFKRWIDQILFDFGLSANNSFGGTSDAGADVKWMLTEGLKLQWEWCNPHLTNTATKAACGIVNYKSQSKNKG